MKKILLVLLFVVLVFAGDQWPFIHPIGKTPSAVLMPNGKGFYTYQDGKVTKWQLNPIQPIESFRIQKKDRRGTGFLRENIFITKDNKRLIFKSREVIQLWDLENKQLIKQLKPNPIYWLATYSDYGFILLDYDSNLQLLDDKSFQVLKQTSIPRNKDYQKVADYRYYPHNMIVGQNILHINYAIESYYIDLKTLKTIESSETNSEDRIWLENAINRNRKSILADLRNNITTQLSIPPNRITYFQKYKDNFNPSIWENFMKFTWKWGTFYSTLSACQIDSSSFITLYKVTDHVSYTLEYTKTSLNNVVETSRYKIWQYGDSWYVEDENHFFNASEDIKKYLYQEDSKGHRTVIDNEIFDRYKKNYKKTLKIKE
ncbi:hypothetical protein [Sulfurimonas microaerophilic]|uniref:hypothetical protein n=1 Tax=Sulfurimonas microaerophilic TaxID=3058392 RepID=UPI00271458F6|nr:hypothetical protein [Sulfurimonas sp. hsl 1-7]